MGTALSGTMLAYRPFGGTMTTLRLPDFLLIGTMKSGSTSLFNWLGTVPGVTLPTEKEPRFFSSDAAFARGLGWYADRFPTAGVTGEASVEYTAPSLASVAAERAAQLVPHARLLCVLREPLARTRSHYRHEVQRSREHRTFLQSLDDPAAPYLPGSGYTHCLEPWYERFPAEHLCVVRFEDLTGPDEAAWRRILAHLGLPEAPRPDRALNVTESKAQYTPLMKRLYANRAALRAAAMVPRPLRRMLRGGLLRDDDAYRELLASSKAAVPDWVHDRLAAGVEGLDKVTGDPTLAWAVRTPAGGQGVLPA